MIVCWKPYCNWLIDKKYIFQIGNLDSYGYSVVSKISQHQYRTAQLVADHRALNMWYTVLHTVYLSKTYKGKHNCELPVCCFNSHFGYLVKLARKIVKTLWRID